MGMGMGMVWVRLWSTASLPLQRVFKTWIHPPNLISSLGNFFADIFQSFPFFIFRLPSGWQSHESFQSGANLSIKKLFPAYCNAMQGHPLYYHPMIWSLQLQLQGRLIWVFLKRQSSFVWPGGQTLAFSILVRILVFSFRQSFSITTKCGCFYNSAF